MTIQGFALIGRSFPIDAFDALYRVSIAARGARRSGAWDAAIRARPVWRGSGEPIVVGALRR